MVQRDLTCEDQRAKTEYGKPLDFFTVARIQAKNLYLTSCFSLTPVGGMGEMKITSEFRMKRQEVCLSDDLDLSLSKCWSKWQNRCVACF